MIGHELRQIRPALDGQWRLTVGIHR